MLRISQNSRVGVAKSYFSTADYYSEGQELTGRWRGVAARKLGLEGDVKQADWESLCDNRHPQTGEQLTPRNETDRTVGYDFNFHVPKSVSILYAMTRDERLLDAFRDSVDATMRDIEAEMATRVRKGRQEREPHDGQHGVGRVRAFHVAAGGRRARSPSARPLLRFQHDLGFARNKPGKPASFATSSGTRRISKRCSIRA